MVDPNTDTNKSIEKLFNGIHRINDDVEVKIDKSRLVRGKGGKNQSYIACDVYIRVQGSIMIRNSVNILIELSTYTKRGKFTGEVDDALIDIKNGLENDVNEAVLLYNIKVSNQRLEKSNKLIEEGNKTINGLKAELDDINKKRELVAKDLEGMENVKQQLDEELKKQTEEIETYKKELELQKKQIEGLTLQNKQVNDEYAIMKGHYDTGKKMYDQLLTDINDVDAELQRKRDEVIKLEEVIVRKTEEVEVLKKFPDQSIVLWNRLLDRLDEMNKNTLTRDELKEYLKSGNNSAVLLERMKKTQQNPLSYRMKLLTYNNEDADLKEQNLGTLKKTLDEINKEIEDIQPTADEIKAANGDPNVAKLNKYRTEYVTELKNKSKEILSSISGKSDKQLSSSIGKFKTLSASEKRKLISKIKI